MTNTNYTLSTGSSDTAGVALGWSGGKAVDYDAFLEACDAIGVRGPDPLSPASALERAMAELVGRRHLSRSYADGASGQRKRGRRALVQETVTGRDLAYEVRLRAEITKDGDIFIFDAQDLPVVDESHPQWDEAVKIVDKVQWHATHLDASDVKTWLIATVTHKLDGVAILRERGGCYYIPPQHVAKLREIRAIVTKHCEIKCESLACVTNDADTVATILSGMSREVAEAIEGAEGQCVEGAQERTFAKHKGALTAVQEKLARYEALCSTQAVELREKLDTVQTHVTMMALGELGAAL